LAYFWPVGEGRVRERGLRYHGQREDVRESGNSEGTYAGWRNEGLGIAFIYVSSCSALCGECAVAVHVRPEKLVVWVQ